MSGIHEKPKGNFVENTVSGLFHAIERAVYADHAADQGQHVGRRIGLGRSDDGICLFLVAESIDIK